MHSFVSLAFDNSKPVATFHSFHFFVPFSSHFSFISIITKVYPGFVAETIFDDEHHLVSLSRGKEGKRKGTRKRKRGAPHLTHHVKPLPYTAPFSKHEGDFSDHRIFQRYHRLEQSLVFNFAWFQMDVRAREDPLHRAVLGREAPVPTCKTVHPSISSACF